MEDKLMLKIGADVSEGLAEIKRVRKEVEKLTESVKELKRAMGKAEIKGSDLVAVLHKVQRLNKVV